MSNPLNSLNHKLGGAVVLCAMGVAAVVQLPVATAGPDPCTASNLANTVSSVSGAAGQYLGSHPDADQALSDAGSAPDAEGTVRSYFIAHPREFLDLKSIAKPLTDLKSQCNATVSPAQISALLRALSN